MKELREGFEKNLEKNGSGVLIRMFVIQSFVVEIQLSMSFFVYPII